MGLLNVDGYYNSLLSFIDKAVDEGFIAPAARYIIVSAQTAHELICKLEVFFFFFFIFCFEPIKVAHVCTRETQPLGGNQNSQKQSTDRSRSFPSGICSQAFWGGIQSKLGDGATVGLHK